MTTLTVVVCLVAPLPTTVPEQVWLYGGTDSRSHRPCTALHALHLCELPSGWVTLTLILTLTLTLTLTRNPNPNPNPDPSPNPNPDADPNPSPNPNQALGTALGGVAWQPSWEAEQARRNPTLP